MLLNSLFVISHQAKESYTQFSRRLFNDGWERLYNKEAHSFKSEDFEEVYYLDNDQYTATLVLFCGYNEHCKCRVYDFDLIDWEEKEPNEKDDSNWWEDAKTEEYIISGYGWD